MSDTTPPETDADAPGPSALLWADASLFGVAVIWGVNIPIMKTGLDQLDAFVFNAIRLAISAAVLVLFALRERRAGNAPRLGEFRNRVLIYALMVSAAYQLLFLLGIDRTTSGNTALIIATVPLWTALLGRVFLDERLRPLAWTGLVIALAGTIIVALQKGDVTAGRGPLLGNVIVLAAALFWAGGTVYSRPLLRRVTPLQLAAYGAVMGLPVHLACAANGFTASMPALDSAQLWAILVYSGVLSSGLALPMWNFGVRHAGAAHAAIIQNLIPLVALFVAWIGRGESATAAQLFGGALILGGLVIMRRGRRPPRDPATAGIS